jgi:hypothetical protein
MFKPAAAGILSVLWHPCRVFGNSEAPRADREVFAQGVCKRVLTWRPAPRQRVNQHSYPVTQEGVVGVFDPGFWCVYVLQQGVDCCTGFQPVLQRQPGECRRLALSQFSQHLTFSPP